MQLLRDLLLLVRAWRIASVKVADEALQRYRPEARHLIAYNQVRLELSRAGHDIEAITGSVIHVAVAFAYRFRKRAH